METPSSIRRLTRSQAAAAAAAASEKNKQDDVKARKGSNSERSALLDITNDSPIVGLTAGCLQGERTPASSVVKNRVRAKQTPGSGEALLRDQVKTLLQKVEEEAELVPFGNPLLPLSAVVDLARSPALLLAPTPTNTPQVPNSSCLEKDSDFVLVKESVAEKDPQQIVVLQVASSGPEEPLSPGDFLINRALLFDSPDSSETYQGRESSCKEKPSPEDDSSSIWSIQVNSSTISNDDDEGCEGEEDYYSEEADEELGEEEEGGEKDEDLFDDLCEGMSKMTVLDDEKPRLPEFMGKHTRFIYDDDGEIQGEEEEVNGKALSPSALVLKGLPAPAGKHLRFPEEDE